MKKSGVFDKAKNKSGVVEGGIDALVEKVKKHESDPMYKDGIRIALFATREIRGAYKAILAKKNITIQEDLMAHILRTIEKEKNK